ncbi:hypothetical protein [Streptomyces malaysiensis]
MPYSKPNLISAADSDFETSIGGWESTTNVTRSTQTTIKVTGVNSMRLAAVAAGTVVTKLTARVPVTAGAEYVLDIPVGRAVSQSGLAAVPTVTWFSVATGGTSISASSVTVALSTGTGFTHSVLVAKAPVGATYGEVSLTVTGMAAGAFVFLDAVYMGVAAVIPGNLLPYNTQDIEQDASGWAGTNTTITRQTSGGGIGPDPGNGYLRAVSVASGAMEVHTASAFAVTPGQEYLAYTWAYSPEAFDQAVTVQIQWLDASDATVGTAATATWTLPTGSSSPTRTNVVGVAPPGAVKARLYTSVVVPVANTWLYIDQVYLGPPPNAPGNLLTYDEYSFESSIPALTVDGCTVAQAAFFTTSNEGAYAALITPTATGFLRVRLDRLVPVVPGESYGASALVMTRADSDPNKTVTARTRIDWYDADENVLLVDSPDQFFLGEATSTYAGVTVTETRTAPDGAAYARISVEIDHRATASTAYYLDMLVLKDSPPAYTLTPSTATGSVTVRVDVMPVTGLGGFYTLLRVHQDGAMQPVRGYGGDQVNVPYTQVPILVEDYEAPIGSRVWYKLDWRDAGGTRLGAVYTQTIDTPVIEDPGYVWLKSPGLPATNTLVQMESPLSWDRAARASVLEPRGRTNPIVITDKRSGRTGSITALVWDENSSALLNALLDSGAPALIQAMPGLGVEGNLYVSIGDVTSAPLVSDAREEGWRWTLAVTEVDRPVGGVQGSATNTWQNLLDNFDTWDDVFNAFDTWADVLISS